MKGINPNSLKIDKVFTLGILSNMWSIEGMNISFDIHWPWIPKYAKKKKNYSRNIIHYRITIIVKEIYMGIKEKQKIKITKNAYGRKFHWLENPRISSYQKKGKVTHPIHCLKGYVIAWILEQALSSFVRGTTTSQI